MRRISLTKIYFPFILLLGIGLRLHNLGGNSLWSDEASFILFRSGNLSDSLKFIRDKLIKEGLDIANYGYRLFTTIWSCFVNNNEFMLRLSSVIFGVFCIVLIYKVGKLFFDKNTGLIASFLLAISPFHIYYSQEFRMYSLISLLTLTSVYFLRRFQQTGKNGFLWGYIISHSLNFYMHIATILILSAQIIFYISYRKKFKDLFKRWLKAQAIILLLIIPGIIITAIELIRIGRAENILRLSCSTTTNIVPNRLLVPFYTFKNFCIGFHATPSIWWPAILLFSALFIFTLIRTKEREALYFCLCCLFIPILIMYIGQRLLYADRYLIPSSLFLYLIVGKGVAYLKKIFTIIILILILILSALTLNNYYKGYLPTPWIAVPDKQDYKEAAKYIFDNFQEGDVIFHTSYNTGIPFLYYFDYYSHKKNTKIISNVFAKEQISLMLLFTQDGRLSCFKPLDKVNAFTSQVIFPVRGHKRVWLVFSSWQFEYACRPGSDERKELEWMEKEYIRKEAKYFKEIIVYLFVKPQNEI